MAKIGRINLLSKFYQKEVGTGQHYGHDGSRGMGRTVAATGAAAWGLMMTATGAAAWGRTVAVWWLCRDSCHGV